MQVRPWVPPVKPEPLPLFLGLDLGQQQDPTALAALERVGRVFDDRTEYHFAARHLQRWPLGTSYPDITAAVQKGLGRPEYQGRPVHLVVDQTGVGRAVVDWMRRQGIRLVAVTITGGDTTVQDEETGDWRVPKRELAAVGQVLLQSGRLKIAERLPEAAILVNELLNFRVKISAAGNDTYSAWREGIHDDLVLAVLLAAWYGNRSGPALDLADVPADAGPKPAFQLGAAW